MGLFPKILGEGEGASSSSVLCKVGDDLLTSHQTQANRSSRPK